ncbi:hypothetical protein L6R53_20875 [Myxococcota bacterium]|nr:hypothetical protein [Myxococcota bacterium]
MSPPLLLLASLLLGPPARAAEALGERIVRLVEAYPTGPALPYTWQPGVDTDGTSRDLSFRGVPLARADDDPGVHCSGLTFEVWWTALEQAGPPDWLTPQDLLALKDRWYVRDGDERGLVGALVDLGLGLPVTDWRALRPGDLVQYWRNSGRGHSAVFLGYRVNADGRPRSMIAWSAQASSEGVGRRYVSVGEGEYQADPHRFYAVRPIRP